MPEFMAVGTLTDPKVYEKTLEKFRGLDLTGGENACAEYRSPDAPNMMPNRDGFPIKRPGYRTLKELDGRINGVYSLELPKKGARHEIVHHGTKLTVDGTTLSADMTDARSSAWQIGDRLWIADGKKLRCLSAEEELKLENAEDIATIPVVTISKAPNGVDGGTSYKPVNLLTGKRTDSFLGTETEKDYFTSFQEWVNTDIKVEILDADGVWQTGTSIKIGDKTITWTVDAALGKVSFSAAPGKPAVEGEDNVRITYEVESKADTINKMRIGVVYGVNGAMDRLFLAGNPDEPTTDRWSEWNDPAYWPDINSGELGQDGAPIIGYSVLGDRLVTHKKSETEGRNAFVRAGELDEDGDAVFRIVNVIQGEGAIAEKGFQSFGGEPVFLTRDGVFALTPSDLTGERYTQLRSWFLNGGLLREKNLEDACSCVWGRFYCLGINGKIYLLDNEQKSYEQRSPNSGYQYEGYLFTDIPARVLWVNKDGLLSFGTEDGRICELGDPTESNTGTDYVSVNDEEGVPVKAWWNTPLMSLGTWSQLKSINNVWIVAVPYRRSSGVVEYATDRKIGKEVRRYTVDIMSFINMQFSRMVFSSIDRGSIFATRKKEKKAKMFQITVKNEEKEPFGLLAITLQYTIGGKIK